MSQSKFYKVVVSLVLVLILVNAGGRVACAIRTFYNRHKKMAGLVMAVAAIIIAAASSAVLADVMTWNTFVPLTSGAYNGIVSDAGGNLYVTGDSGVVKLDNNGNRLWSTSLGGTGKGIALDANGNVYVTGETATSWGTPINAYSGGKDIFIAKLNSSGTMLWNTFLGSSADDYGRGIAVDGTGNIYITGSSSASWGSPLNAYAGAGEIVIVKLNTNGTVLWNTFFGSAAKADGGRGIAVDGGGNIYVAGTSYASWGSPINANPTTDYLEFFVAKLNNSGNLLWNSFPGSPQGMMPNVMMIDGKGNAYIGGYATCVNNTWDNIIDACPSIHGPRKGFVYKVDANGNRVWSTVMGGSSEAFVAVYGISVDADGNVYATGTSGDGRSVYSWGDPVIPPTKTAEDFAIKLDGNNGKRVVVFY